MAKCKKCGYPCTETEYHPYEYCVLVKAEIEPEEFIHREIKRRNIQKDADRSVKIIVLGILIPTSQ